MADVLAKAQHKSGSDTASKSWPWEKISSTKHHINERMTW